jgi:hypothetical protein
MKSICHMLEEVKGIRSMPFGLEKSLCKAERIEGVHRERIMEVACV